MPIEKALEAKTAEELQVSAALAASQDTAEKEAAFDALVEIEERAAAEAGARQLELERARARRSAKVEPK